MVRRKNNQKNLRISDEDAERSKFLREAAELGLTDSDIYGKGLNAYETELETIRRGLDTGKKPIRRSDYKNIPDHMWDDFKAAHDAREKPFMTDYQRELARLRGEKVPAQDEYGFKVYPKEKPKGEAHPLDRIYGGHDAAPPQELLEYFTLSIESWYNLLESERLAIRQRWEEITRYPNR